jgi:HK97 family phage portal protein
VSLTVRSFLGLDQRSTPLGAPSAADLVTAGYLPPADATGPGAKVTDDAALCVSAVYACVGLLSDAIATLPVDAYLRNGNDRQEMSPRPRWLDTPNTDDLPVDVWSEIVVSLLLRGNAYIATRRNPDGTVADLIVLDPSRVVPRLVKGTDGRTFVAYEIDGKRPLLSRRDVLHISGMRRPGSLVGMSPIDHARESLSVSLAAQRHGAAFLENNATPGAVVEVANPVSPVGVEQLKAAWESIHGGPANAGKLAVLTEGAKFSAVSITPEDAELLETRRFQVADVARIYRVPTHLLSDSTKSTTWGAGIHEQNVAFAQYSLRPWLSRLEARLSWLLQSEGHAEGFVRFNLDGLLRANQAERYAAYSTGLDAGFLTVDEVRAWEDLDPMTTATPAPEG